MGSLACSLAQQSAIKLIVEMIHKHFIKYGISCDEHRIETPLHSPKTVTMSNSYERA